MGKVTELNSPPPVVLDYLKEGNSKEDLIEWLWSRLSDDEKADIIKESNEQFSDTTDPTMPMGPNGNVCIDDDITERVACDPTNDVYE